jgi:hypothetical protein
MTGVVSGIPTRGAHAAATAAVEAVFRNSRLELSIGRVNER